MSTSLSSSLSSSISTGALSAHPFLNMGLSASKLQHHQQQQQQQQQQRHQQQQPQQQKKHQQPSHQPAPPPLLPLSDSQHQSSGSRPNGDLTVELPHYPDTLPSPLRTPTQASVSAASHHHAQHRQQHSLPSSSSFQQLNGQTTPNKLRRQLSDIRRPAMPSRTSSSSSESQHMQQQVAYRPSTPSGGDASAPLSAGSSSSKGVKFPDSLPLPLPRKAASRNTNGSAHSRSMSVPEMEESGGQQPRRFGIVRKLSLRRFSDRTGPMSGSAPPPSSSSHGHSGGVAASMIPRSLSRKGSLSRLGSSRGAQSAKRSAVAAEVPPTSSTQPPTTPTAHPTVGGGIPPAQPIRQPTRSASHMANLGLGVPSPVMEDSETMETPSTPPAQTLSPESAARRARATRESNLSPRKSSFRGIRASSSPYSRQAHHRSPGASSTVSSSSKSSISPAQRAAREWRAKLVNLSSASPEHTDEEVAATGFGGPRPPPRPKTAAAGNSNPTTPLSEVPPLRPRHRRRSLDSLVSVSTKSVRHANVSPACSAFGDAFDEQQRLSIWSADFDALSLHATSMTSSAVSKVSRATTKSMKSTKSKASTNLTMVPEVPKIPDHMLPQLSAISGVEPSFADVAISAVGGAQGTEIGTEIDTASFLTKSTRGHVRSATEGQSSVVTASVATASTESFSTPEWQPSERLVAVRSSAPNMAPVQSDAAKAEPEMLRGLGLKMDLASLKSKPLPPPPGSESTTPPPSLSPDNGTQAADSPYPSLSSIRRTSTPDHTEYLVTPTCATGDEKMMARGGPVGSDSEGESAPPVRKELGQRPMGPRKNYNGHIRDSSDVKMAVAMAHNHTQAHKLTRSYSSDSRTSKVHIDGPREPTRYSSGSVSRSTSHTLVNPPVVIPRESEKEEFVDAETGPEPLKLSSYDLTPGLEDGGRRPRKKGMPMQDLRRWLETSR